MSKKCLLNNMKMNMYRRSMEYQAVIIDLALSGIVNKEKCEQLLGYKIPAYIKPRISVAADKDVEDDEAADE